MRNFRGGGGFEKFSGGGGVEKFFGVGGCEIFGGGGGVVEKFSCEDEKFSGERVESGGVKFFR